MLTQLQRQLRRHPTSFVLLTLALWWSAALLLTRTFNSDNEYLYDDDQEASHSVTLGKDGFISRHKKAEMRRERLSRRERTLVTIVCNTNQDPDQYKRNIFQRQLNQTKTMLKSLVYFSSSSFRVVVITDTKDTFQSVQEQLRDWPSRYRSRLRLERAELWLPEQDSLLLEGWRPCSWPKLFLHEALPRLDAAVYVDTDVVFLGPADGLWDILEGLKPPQAFAIGPDPYYEKYKHRKYAGTVGLSAGLMAVNFTRLRSFSTQHGGFTKTIMYYKDNFVNSHDQDTLNGLLADHPKMFVELGPQWMFCPSQCLKGFIPCCLDTGVNVLHGFDAVFVRGVEMVFQVLYEAMLNLDLESPATTLRDNLEKEFFKVDRNALSSTCRKVTGIQSILTKHIQDLASAEGGHAKNNSVTEWYQWKG